MQRSTNLPPTDQAALEAFARAVRGALGNALVDLKLFGSKATGHAAPDSDLDVLVLVEDASLDTEDRVIDIAYDVNLAHDVYISPRVVARATLDDPVWKLTPFVQVLARTGIPL